MKLFIIGNGFDIGHGLATRYWDFRNYLEQINYTFLQSFEEHYDIYPRSSIDAIQKTLWNEFEQNLANIDEDTIIDQAVNIDMDLESGDIGIEDTLVAYFTNEYRYIKQLAKYLKSWVRTIRIRDVQPKTTLFDNDTDALFITFNYTSSLESVYKIDPTKVIHVHGSLHKYDDEPILGHGNIERITTIRDKRRKAEDLFDEKWSSICQVVENYYNETFKDVRRYMYKLFPLRGKSIDEIHVIGLSISGVDLPYFEFINNVTNRNASWNIYCFSNTETTQKKSALLKCGVNESCIRTMPTAEFYNA